jgi:hypothetical protein
MPRFYFHVHNDYDAEDQEGMELPDLTAARTFAVESARDLVCESVSKGHLNLDHRIDIADEDGTVLQSVTFREAFTITGQAQEEYKRRAAYDDGAS